MIKILDVDSLEISSLEIKTRLTYSKPKKGSPLYDYGIRMPTGIEPEGFEVKYDIEGFKNKVLLDGEDFIEIYDLIKEKIMNRLDQAETKVKA